MSGLEAAGVGAEPLHSVTSYIRYLITARKAFKKIVEQSLNRDMQGGARKYGGGGQIQDL